MITLRLPAGRRLLSCLCVLIALATGNAAARADSAPLDRQHQAWRAALAAIQRGSLSLTEAQRAALAGYPLYPYIELAELSRRLPALGREEVDAFLARYPDQLPAARLRAAWLDTLERQARWTDFLAYHVADPADAALGCRHAWALHQAGRDEEAWREAATLWMSARSLPQACDRLFQAWYRSGGPGPALAWQRFHLAQSSGQPGLGTYLTRFLDARGKAAAALYLRVRDNPALVRNPANLAGAGSHAAQIAAIGLRQLAARDAEGARRAFELYANTGTLEIADQRVLAPRIATALAGRDAPAAVEWIAGLRPEAVEDALAEDAVRYALRGSDWDRIDAALHRLPPAVATAQRWQYWVARSREVRGTDPADPALQAAYAAVRAERSWYGFLAADRLGTAYDMQHQPVPATAEQLAATEALPGIARAREFWRIGQHADSRREWSHTLRHLGNEDKARAAKLAGRWGWPQLAIGALTAAAYWNDLELRFPVLYREQFRQAARHQRIEPTWLYAITRQESVFNAGIKSPAGAVGLMQVMPATAQHTAQRGGIAYRGAHDLLNPTTNVTIGSHYMRMVLNDFGDNRILAAAAYNAGPGRVRQWLARVPGTVEHDQFVETIPFRETRQYVQNVLAFAVIYAYLDGRKVSLVQPGERLIANPAARARTASAASGNNGNRRS